MSLINSNPTPNLFNKAQARVDQLKMKLSGNWHLTVVAIILAMGALATLGYFSGMICAPNQILLNNVSIQVALSMALFLTAIAAGLVARRTILKSDLAIARESLTQDWVKLRKEADVGPGAQELAKDKKLLVFHLITEDPAFIQNCCDHVDSVEDLIQEISKSRIVENCPQEWRSNLKKNLKIVQEKARSKLPSDKGELLLKLKKMISFNDKEFLASHLITAQPDLIQTYCKDVDSVEDLIQEISKSRIVENCPQQWRSNLKKNLKIVQEKAQITLNDEDLLSKLNKMISFLDGNAVTKT